MISSLSQEDITEYASDAVTIQEPAGTNYSQGAQVGKTVPAKWWNWLFNAITKRLRQARTDANNMLTELQNVVTDTGAELDPSDSTQLVKAVRDTSKSTVYAFTDAKKNPLTTLRRCVYRYEGSTITNLRSALQSIEAPATARRVFIEFGDKYIMVVEGKFTISGQIAIAVSTDMMTWDIVQVSRFDVKEFFGIYYVDNTLVVAAYSSTYKTVFMYKSTDGVTWSYSDICTLNTSAATDFAAVNGALLVTYNSSTDLTTRMYMSTDLGSSWEQIADGVGYVATYSPFMVSEKYNKIYLAMGYNSIKYLDVLSKSLIDIDVTGASTDKHLAAGHYMTKVVEHNGITFLINDGHGDDHDTLIFTSATTAVSLYSLNKERYPKFTVNEIVYSHDAHKYFSLKCSNADGSTYAVIYSSDDGQIWTEYYDTHGLAYHNLRCLPQKLLLSKNTNDYTLSLVPGSKLTLVNTNNANTVICDTVELEYACISGMSEDGTKHTVSIDGTYFWDLDVDYIDRADTFYAFAQSKSKDVLVYSHNDKIYYGTVTDNFVSHGTLYLR